MSLQRSFQLLVADALTNHGYFTDIRDSIKIMSYEKNYSVVQAVRDKLAVSVVTIVFRPNDTFGGVVVEVTNDSEEVTILAKLGYMREEVL